MNAIERITCLFGGIFLAMIFIVHFVPFMWHIEDYSIRNRYKSVWYLLTGRNPYDI